MIIIERVLLSMQPQISLRYTNFVAEPDILVWQQDDISKLIRQHA